MTGFRRRKRLVAVMLADDIEYPSATATGVEHIANTTWRALSTIVTEHHQAFRRALDGRSFLETSGQVHHQQESNTTEQHPPDEVKQVTQQSTEGDLVQNQTVQPARHTASTHEGVQAELQRIQQNTSMLNLEKDVVVQLDFMSGLASRTAAVAVSIALLVALTVLLAQVIKKFQLVSATCRVHSVSLLNRTLSGFGNLMQHECCAGKLSIPF